MSIKKVSVVTPNGEHTIMTSRPKAVRAVITVRQQVMEHVSAVLKQTARHNRMCQLCTNSKITVSSAQAVVSIGI